MGIPRSREAVPRRTEGVFLPTVPGMRSGACPLRDINVTVRHEHRPTPHQSQLHNLSLAPS